MNDNVMYLFTNGLRLLIEQTIKRIHPDDRDRFLDDIQEQIEHYKTELRKYPAGPARAKAAQEAIDTLVNRSKAKSEHWKQVSCRAACSHCCHTTVLLSLDETAVLAAKVKSGEVPVDMARLEEQANFKGDEMQWWRLPLEKNRCVFLGADNLCRVYEDRPNSCRKYFVGSPPENCGNRVNTESMILAEFDVEIVATAAADIDKNIDPLPKSLWKALQKETPTNG